MKKHHFVLYDDRFLQSCSVLKKKWFYFSRPFDIMCKILGDCSLDPTKWQTLVFIYHASETLDSAQQIKIYYYIQM